MFKWVILLIVLAAGAAWLTKPGVAAFDDMLRARLEHQIATEDVGSQEDPIAAIALVACKLRPSGCFKLVREGLEVTVDDRVLYTQIRADGFGTRTVCTGAFTRLWCREVVQ
ncbi:hypothetical protein [Albidovulum sp.]|uniref:hypothetical protein n=1 Tax=Albidovulum sp. TaxID=1872424 RepID=UPI002CA68459|nr:hypothetical protein [Defluviimonas sp.]MCO5126394.1 hypothetical protein [Paracoccaceae bacterium]MCP5354859.1 hypothetical protein [Paracoccaceae bacterium]HPE25981.1 hypothetical protein [Albidovulum sp.]HRV61607.1 hypothetical protein [Albidovulum sp.]